MIYSIYSNCSDDDFISFRKKLDDLENKIIQLFPASLEEKHRYDDSDSLNLNFKVKDNSPFKGNFAITFNDSPGLKTFTVRILKTLDLEGYRYGKKKVVRENVTLSEIDEEIAIIVEEMLNEYNSLGYDEIINSDKTKLGNHNGNIDKNPL